MLLGNDLLERFAEIWRHRETVEWEAADQFERHARMLREVGAPAVVSDMAEAAAQEEVEHAHMCRAIVDRLHPGLDPIAPTRSIQLGVHGLTKRQQTLYTSVALSCVTETLSSALLLAMSKVVQDELVANTVHHILRDEISHSRLGWAHLASEAERGDVSWLGEFVSGMLRDAVRADRQLMASGEPSNTVNDASSYGILSGPQVAALTKESLDMIIRPGFERFGIHIVA